MENTDKIIDYSDVVVEQPTETCSKCKANKEKKEKKTCNKCNQTKKIFWKSAAIGLTTIALSIYGLIHLVKTIIESLS